MEDTVYGLFKSVVERQSDAPAIIEDGRTMSFAELSAMTDMIADSFPDGTRSVGIVMRHRAELVASILAVLKTGARYVPAEPTFPAGRIRFMMDESKVDFIVTEMQYASRLAGFSHIYSDCSICTVRSLTPRPTSSTRPARRGGPRA